MNIAAFQPLLIGQLGGGTYWRSTGIMNYDFENSAYNVPLGLGIGQVWKSGTTIYNLFVEPQWSVASKGAGWPRVAGVRRPQHGVQVSRRRSGPVICGRNEEN